MHCAQNLPADGSLEKIRYIYGSGNYTTLPCSHLSAVENALDKRLHERLYRFRCGTFS